MTLDFKHIYKILLILFLLAVAIFTIGRISHSQVEYLKIKKKDVPINFYWDYYSDTNNIIGFNIHKSMISGVYDPNSIYFSIYDPNARSMEAPPINKEGTYFFTATAEEDDGDISGPSNEVKVEINFPPESPSGLGCLPGL